MATNPAKIAPVTAVVPEPVTAPPPVHEKTPGEIAIEQAEERAAAVVKENVPEALLTRHYRVLVDGITASDPQQALGIVVLKDIVTRADIENSGADFEWLLKSGAIEDVGFRQ